MSKKKKLIVVSSVLAACMLFSVSALALSSQEETTSVGDSSAVAFSDGNVEKVISEEVSEENVAEIQQILNFSTVTTYEKVEEVLGEPISTRGSYDLSDEWSTVTKTYKTNNGEEVKVDYRYDSKTDTEKVSYIELSDGCCIIPEVYTTSEYKDYSLKTDLTTEQFKQFVRYETTAEEVRTIVGRPHAFFGSGMLYDVYYTVDGDALSIYYTNNYIINEDGTVIRGNTPVVNVILLRTGNDDVRKKDISTKGEIYEALKSTEEYAIFL